MDPLDEEELSATISREKASAAGLLAAALFFALAVGAFVVLNVFWPAAQIITKPKPDIPDSGLPKNTDK